MQGEGVSCYCSRSRHCSVRLVEDNDGGERLGFYVCDNPEERERCLFFQWQEDPLLAQSSSSAAAIATLRRGAADYTRNQQNGAKYYFSKSFIALRKEEMILQANSDAFEEAVRENEKATMAAEAEVEAKAEEEEEDHDADDDISNSEEQKRKRLNEEEEDCEMFKKKKTTVTAVAPSPSASTTTVPTSSSSTLSPAKVNYNEQIVKVLDQKRKQYGIDGEEWRKYSYTRAIDALRRFPRPILSGEDARRSIDGIGRRLAMKIDEILATGQLRHVEAQKSRMAPLQLFEGIFGVASETARRWVADGARTLDDIRARNDLTHQQRIGLEYYDDLQQRMPRREVEEVAALVETEARRVVMTLAGTVPPEQAASLANLLELIICGSYRRGSETSGDVDLVFCHPVDSIALALLPPLIRRLKEQKFIVADLTHFDSSSSFSSTPHPGMEMSTGDVYQPKFMGICILPSSESTTTTTTTTTSSSSSSTFNNNSDDNSNKRRHRHIDIVCCTLDERATTVLGWTGDAMFNRRMRQRAHEYGYTLSHHAIRQATEVGSGSERRRLLTSGKLTVKSEADVFHLLGLEYMEPNEREGGVFPVKD